MATAMRATAVALLAATAMALPQIRQLQTQAAPFRLDTNGAQVDGEIAVAAQQSWFIFTAQGGTSYQIQTIIGTFYVTFYRPMKDLRARWRRGRSRWRR